MLGIVDDTITISGPCSALVAVVSARVATRQVCTTLSLAQIVGAVHILMTRYVDCVPTTGDASLDFDLTLNQIEVL